jgi:hypothetical protein
MMMKLKCALRTLTTTKGLIYIHIYSPCELNGTFTSTVTSHLFVSLDAVQ